MTAIHVYRFSDAPCIFRNLCCFNGGDEDWLAIVPREYGTETLLWLQTGSSFGCCTVDLYRVSEDGELLYYGDESQDRDVPQVVPLGGRFDRAALKRWAGCSIYVGCHA